MEPYPEQLQIQVEVPKGGRIKRGPDGHIDFISPFPCPFNYGSVIGSTALDGDPEDALIVGGRIAIGEFVDSTVWGRVNFLDAGVADHKWVCGPRAPTENEWLIIRLFFRNYVWAKRILYWIRATSGRVEYLGIERFAVVDNEPR